jgi:hypothetical protein
VTRRYQPVYWSPCCGVPAEYQGFYQCSACKARMEVGTLTQVSAAQAEAVREVRKAQEQAKPVQGELFGAEAATAAEGGDGR